ncbi:MAG: isoprenylcysteine carboxylmethyltransferase family protein [Rhizobiaceae bacterium]|nr:isoprenylcysteine carboxylmethyltransferase family protein [Rhizobiaceae bacterium]
MTLEPPNRIPWPPLIYIAAVAAAVVADWLYPLPWIGSPLADFLFAIGGICIAGALALDFSAMSAMRKAKTPIMPTSSAQHLLTTGAFGLSRNPIYLGNTTLMIGIGLLSQSLWFILFGIVAAFATQKLAIEREEKHLNQRFGKKYVDYTKRVRRWI